MDKIKIGVVGCGHIGKRHIEVILANKNAELVAICDNNQQVLDRYNLKGVQKFTSYTDFLEADHLELICICTPHGLHSSMSIQASKKKKNVLVEKPMALTLEESKRMIDTAKENHTSLFVVKQNRFNKPIVLVKKALQDNRLGKIYMVQSNVFWNRNDEYYSNSNWRGKTDLEGGALHTQVSHFIDLLLWFFGDILEAKTLTARLKHDIEFEDCGTTAFKFENDAIGSLNWTTCVYNKNYEGSITIIGEKGTIKIGGKYLNKIEFWDVQSYPEPDMSEFDDRVNDYGSYQGSSSNHDKLFSTLVRELVENRKGLVEGIEGQKTIAAIEKIYNS